jgi:hypothetical protein
MRVQLMKALKFVHQGGLLVYRLETERIENEAQLMLGEYFIQDRNWFTDKVVPLFVPGTVCPQMIGEALVRFGWVRPVNNHGTGYARNFVLSESGEKALDGASSWWRSLSWYQKTWLYLTE